jgi:hypothetical protein
MNEAIVCPDHDTDALIIDISPSGYATGWCPVQDEDDDPVHGGHSVEVFLD